MLIGKIMQICIARSSLLHILYSFYGEVLKGYFTYKRLKQKTDGAGVFEANLKDLKNVFKLK